MLYPIITLFSTVLLILQLDLFIQHLVYISDNKLWFKSKPTYSISCSFSIYFYATADIDIRILPNYK